MTTTAAKRSESNADANKLGSADRPIHDWYRFVLSFPPHLVGQYLDRFGITDKQVVLDPFCGTATTVVECKKRGIPGVGIEAHPMAYFAAAVKTDWAVDPEELIAHARLVAEEARQELFLAGIQDDEDCSDRIPSLRLLTLPPSAHALLLTSSISPLPLHKSLVLLALLQTRSASQCHKYELLALARGLVTTIGNLHFGPEVGISPAKSDAPVISTWLAQVESMAHDLAQVRRHGQAWSQILRADSRGLGDILQPGSIDAVITSPPYPNEKDYTRTTRLESVLLGLIRTKQELKDLKHSLMRSNTRNVYRGDDDDTWVAHNKEIQGIAARIEARRIELMKTSGFERLYPRVTKLYFGGMARHLNTLKTALRPGACLAYVVGDQASYLQIMIRTGKILADIAKEQGYEVLGIDLFRTRLATATKQQLREEVVLLRWNG